MYYILKKEVNEMRPLQISAETAQKLAKALDVPIEQIMHLPQHILVQKLVEIEREEAKKNS
ncbi:tRNA A37 threonylcarbamoyltransferase TsaD [Bacillus tianshenii]|uniref:tRNA A37 threonylcarbamoyltransferase TsaD n=1 Tax=Sutcliffiella tianshenii TaxID=1463404 RepID=A0ABS2P1Z2_9BACI|nr:tRNA A37 threonylcarbamoyltransferase TsaD [Bacillus tianshenii]